jgi:hypothetical protein
MSIRHCLLLTCSPAPTSYISIPEPDATRDHHGPVRPLPCARYDVEHIAFVRPDVAVVGVRQRPTGPDGVPLADWSEGRPTYVMAKDATGAWKIRSGQNTLVADD